MGLNLAAKTKWNKVDWSNLDVDNLRKDTSPKSLTNQASAYSKVDWGSVEQNYDPNNKTIKNGIVNDKTDHDSSSDSNYGINQIVQASREKRFAIPQIHNSNKQLFEGKVVDSPRTRIAGPVVQSIARTISEPVFSLDRGSKEISKGRVGEGMVDIGAGLLHGAMAPVTTPINAALAGLKEGGNLGNETAIALENLFNLPFDAIKTGSNITRNVLETVGVNPSKIENAAGISPELSQKGNDLLTELGGLTLLSKAHSGAKDFIENKSPIKQLNTVDNKPTTNTSLLTNETNLLKEAEGYQLAKAKDKFENQSTDFETNLEKAPSSETEVAKAFKGVEENPSLFSNVTHKLLGDESLNRSVEKLDNFLSYFNKDKLKESYNDAMGYLDGLKGKTFSRITRANQAAGEAGARYISARYAAEFLGKDMSDKILNNEADPNLIGALLTEDNLRSVKKNFIDEGNTEAANDVKTLVGDKGYFKTEEEYQNYLNEPINQKVINRYTELFANDKMDKLYKKAHDILMDEDLPKRGLQTNARINLLAIPKGSKIKKERIGLATKSSDQLGTMKRDSPFAKEAKGNAESYNINLHDIVSNSFGKQLEAATYKDFLNDLVNSGLAKIDKPGMNVELGGKKTISFPIQRKTVVIAKDGSSYTIPKNENIYVRGDLAREFRIGANLDAPTRGEILQKVNQSLNSAALQGLTDATAHATNLTSALLSRPGIGGDAIREGIAATGGIGDFGVVVERMISKAIDMHKETPHVKKQLAELSSIGALRQGMHSGVMGNFLLNYDRTTRLVMDDAYNFLADKGLVEKSETARREFINQVGQYNRRAQGSIMRALKDLGVSPFITAGKTFANLAVKNITADPGVKATSKSASAKLRALTASRFAGTAGTIMLTNYLLTHEKGGGVWGRPGTPLFAIDTGKDDELGKPIVINAMGKIFGYDRALRSTGIKGFVESKMHGLNNTQAIHSSLRDAVNTGIGMVAGPPVRFAVGAVTGYPTAIDMSRQFPIVPPGKSQKVSDLKNALLASNPLSETYRQIQEKGTDIPSAFQIGLEKQLPGFTPRAGMNPETEANLPKIVDQRELKDYIDFVAKEARKRPIDKRRDYLIQMLDEVSGELRGRAVYELKRRGF